MSRRYSLFYSFEYVNRLVKEKIVFSLINNKVKLLLIRTIKLNTHMCYEKGGSDSWSFIIFHVFIGMW